MCRSSPVTGSQRRRSMAGDEPYACRFVPNNPASGLPAARELPGWLPLDCRHGRALFCTASPGRDAELIHDLVVWNPLTNEQRRLPRLSPLPKIFGDWYFNAAVLCATAAEGCDHRDCHGRPFHVAFVWTSSKDLFRPYVTSACLYSSETGDWSEPTSVQHPDLYLDMRAYHIALVGDKLYFRCIGWRRAFEYQLGVWRLSIVDGPPPSLCQSYAIYLVSMVDGGLRSIDVEEEPSFCLRLWSREATPNDDGVAQWTRGRAIVLETLLPDGALPVSRSAPSSAPRIPSISLLGFLEGADVFFVGTQMRGHPGGVYMVELNSGRARKVFDEGTLVIPYTSFCMPVIDVASTSEEPGEGASSADKNLKLLMQGLLKQAMSLGFFTGEWCHNSLGS
ncbi:hypothetical protein ACQ4PT_035982 [Festuca glaucescens]